MEERKEAEKTASAIDAAASAIVESASPPSSKLMQQSPRSGKIAEKSAVFGVSQQSIPIVKASVEQQSKSMSQQSIPTLPKKAESSPPPLKKSSEVKKSPREGGEANDDPSKNPRAAIAALDSNDANLVSLVLHNNTSFAMKHAEMSELLGKALAKNTVLERLELVKCDLDKNDAILLSKVMRQFLLFCF